MSQFIDLRSDTVTQPTPEMREAIAHAEVGDDVIDVDPTINRLEKRTAEMLGKEAAIFMPSGSMTNQIAIRIHCKPGDEFICEEGCHIYNYEQASFAQLSGIVARIVHGEGGVLRLQQLEGLIRPVNEHMVRTRMVTIENTHNRGAGRVQPYDEVVSICNWAHENDLRTHLDGARLFNAAAASKIDVATWAALFDTVSVCFSKGLGAPVGSALAGRTKDIAEARRHRKLFGGGMRQGGIIAAGALYALENHIDRLTEDHANAQILAEAINKCSKLQLEPAQVDTNILIFHVDPAYATAAQFVDTLRENGLLALAAGKEIVRLVTHLDVSTEDCQNAGATLLRLAG